MKNKFLRKKIREILLMEVRRNPELNLKKSVEQQIQEFIDKHSNSLDKVFISFRDEERVNFINPKSRYNSPVGLYTYPWGGYFDKEFNKFKGGEINFSNSVPFGGNKKFIMLISISSSANILNEKTKHQDLIPYAEKLLKFYPQRKDLIETYIKINQVWNQWNSINDIHKFWLLVEEIAKKESRGSKFLAMSRIFREIGIDGISDNGTNFIHMQEPTQTVFFKGLSIIDDYKIIKLKK